MTSSNGNGKQNNVMFELNASNLETASIGSVEDVESRPKSNTFMRKSATAQSALSRMTNGPDGKPMRVKRHVEKGGLKYGSFVV